MSLDVYLEAKRPIEVFTANITHNVGRMAREAGIYEALWEPEEHGIEEAGQLIPILRAGIERLTADPDGFRKFNPENGWGSYEGLLEFTRRYLAACEDNPDATVRVWR